MSRPQNILRILAMIIAAAVAISTYDAFFKLFSREFTIWQFFDLSGLRAIPILIVLLWISLAFRNTPSRHLVQLVEINAPRQPKCKM